MKISRVVAGQKVVVMAGADRGKTGPVHSVAGGRVYVHIGVRSNARALRGFSPKDLAPIVVEA